MARKLNKIQEQTIRLCDRSVAIRTAPAVIPIMNEVWHGNSPDYLALHTTRDDIVILPGSLFTLQTLFLWMDDQPGTLAVYLYRNHALYAEFKASEQAFVTYEDDRIVIDDLLCKAIRTDYELPLAGQTLPGSWKQTLYSHLCAYSWIVPEKPAP